MARHLGLAGVLDLCGLPRTYDTFVAIYLNLPVLDAAAVQDVADGVAIGTDRATVPDGAIELLCDDPDERAKWRARELRKRL